MNLNIYIIFNIFILLSLAVKKKIFSDYARHRTKKHANINKTFMGSNNKSTVDPNIYHEFGIIL